MKPTDRIITVVLPLTSSQRQVSKPCHVPGAYKHASTPMTSSSHSLDQLTVNNNPRVFIADPSPGRRCSYRIHYILFQNHLAVVGARYSRPQEPVHLHERHYTHKTVPGLFRFRVVHSAGLFDGLIGPIRFSPKGSFPVTGLPKRSSHVIVRLCLESKRLIRVGFPNIVGLIPIALLKEIRYTGAIDAIYCIMNIGY